MKSQISSVYWTVKVCEAQWQQDLWNGMLADKSPKESSLTDFLVRLRCLSWQQENQKRAGIVSWFSKIVWVQRCNCYSSCDLVSKESALSITCEPPGNFRQLIVAADVCTVSCTYDRQWFANLDEDRRERGRENRKDTI